MVASSYLAYGGQLSVIRADDEKDGGLRNAFVGSASSIKIKSSEHYQELGYQENTLDTVTVASRNPGSWANGVRVAIIDGKADQVLGISTATLQVGYGLTQAVPANTVISGVGGTSNLDGHFKGVITEIGVGEASVKFVSHVSAGGTETAQDFNSIYKFGVANVAIHTNGQSDSYGSTAVSTQKDWFDQQTYEVTTASVGGEETTVTAKCNAIADKPGTSEYTASRGGRFDEVHVVVIDAKGTVCLLYTSPSPRDRTRSRMPSSA